MECVGVDTKRPITKRPILQNAQSYKTPKTKHPITKRLMQHKTPNATKRPMQQNAQPKKNAQIPKNVKNR